MNHLGDIFNLSLTRMKFFKAIDNYFQNSNSFDEPIKEKEPAVEASEEVE